MAMRIQCPSCGASLSAPDSYHGKTIACPKCNNRFPALNEEERHKEKSSSASETTREEAVTEKRGGEFEDKTGPDKTTWVEIEVPELTEVLQMIQSLKMTLERLSGPNWTLKDLEKVEILARRTIERAVKKLNAVTEVMKELRERTKTSMEFLPADETMVAQGEDLGLKVEMSLMLGPRACEKCKKLASQGPWDSKDPNRPRLPVHPGCRCCWGERAYRPEEK